MIFTHICLSLSIFLVFEGLASFSGFGFFMCSRIRKKVKVNKYLFLFEVHRNVNDYAHAILVFLAYA